MSKLPVLDSLKQQHKKIQRLYFPKYGDPSIYNNCGRKHYIQSSMFTLPYATLQQKEEYNQILNKKLEMEGNYFKGNYQQMKPIQRNNSYLQYQNLSINDSLQRQAQSKRYHKIQTRNQRELKQKYNQSSLGNERTINVIQRQREFSMQQKLRNEDRYAGKYQKIKNRVNTQADHRTDLSMQPSQNRKRTKTEFNEPGQVKIMLKPPRFSPTFLSSLNY